MKSSALLIILFIFLNGCVLYSSPEDKLQLSQITKISELSGIYNNKGDPEGYLSQIIWGHHPLKLSSTKDSIKHNEIEQIKVSTKENILVVEAIKSECVIYKKQYTAGRDFEITNGKIVLRDDLTLHPMAGDDPLVGVLYEKVIIGLNTDGHGAIKGYGGGAGLVYLVMPVAGYSVADIRFKRLKTISLNNKCNNR